MDKNLMRDSFDEFFNDSSIPEKLENIENITDLLTKNPKIDNNRIDLIKQRSKFQDKAKKTINSLLKFYLDEKVIESDEYIQQKAELDGKSFGEILNQVENSNHAIETLIGLIDMGEVSPRTFEVLADQQRTFIELIKMRSMLLVQIEDSVKKLVSDRNMYKVKELEDESEDKNGKSFTVRGSRGLMNSIQDLIKNKQIEEAITNE